MRKHVVSKVKQQGTFPKPDVLPGAAKLGGVQKLHLCEEKPVGHVM